MSASSIRLRSAPEGGRPQAPPHEDLTPLVAEQRILFLVHGYNNASKAAQEAFAGFESLQREICGRGPDDDYAVGWHVARVFWAGDKDWSIASPLFYPGAVANARDTGPLLAGVIAGLGGHEGAPGTGALIEVAFVAHSLGCRVVLETLHQMLTLGCRARVARVVFFAAAVPTFKLEGSGRSDLASAAERIESEWLSLFSEQDGVLSNAFPLGQSFASGEEGGLPCALGHALWASANTTAVLSQAENRGAGHSDYWGWDAKTRGSRGRFAGYHARTTLRLEPAPLERPVESRDGVIRASEARETAAREQEARALPWFFASP